MKSNNMNISFDLPAVLAVVLVTLKLTEVIDWSWWWVLSPIWIPTSIAMTAFLALLYITWRKR